jgi:hypothetical protein
MDADDLLAALRFARDHELPMSVRRSRLVALKDRHDPDPQPGRQR